MKKLMISIALTCAVSSAVSSAAAQTRGSTITLTPFSFAPQTGSATAADSGTLTVMKNRRHPARGTISIPVVRFRSTGVAPGSPVIYISGGTGSGIAAARGPRFGMFNALRTVGDVITLDLRGAGRSSPRVDCANAQFDVSRPMTYEAVVATLTAQAGRCADSLRAAGVDLTGHSIREIVEDMEALRRALGVPRVSLVGISTGSQIVLEYLRRHPGNVDRIIAAGVQAPDQNRHSPADQELVLRGFGESSAAGAGSVLPLLRQVLDTLDRAPRTVSLKNGANTTEVGLGKFDVQLLVSGTLGDRRQMAFLPRLLGAAAKGDYTMLAGAKIQGARGGITSAYEASMDCQTGAPSARNREVKREAETALLGIATLDFPEQCAAWGVDQLDESFRRPVRSNARVLLISGTLDGRTPVRNAREALKYLPNGSHLIVDGASHGDDLFLSSPEIVPAILRFLAREAVPRHLFLKVPRQ